MKMTEMLQAEITATLSRIDLSVTKFSSLFNDVNSLRTSQELIRIKPYLDFCLEEVVHHIDRIDKNREKLIELNFNDWSSRTVIHRNTAISQKFEMKAMLRRFDDLLDSKLMEEKVLQNTTELLEVAKRGANISPDSNLPNTLHNSLRIGSSNSPIEHFASRRDDVSSNTAFDYTTSRTLNISLNSDRRPSMLEQLRSLAPEVSIHEPNKRRRQTGSTEYLNEQQGERLLSGETEPFTTPYKKKVKKVPEPVNIPLDRQSFYNDIPPGAAAPVLFDPRSKEFQIWKKEVKRLDETIGSSLRSYHIPTDLEHLKEDFQRYSRKLSCNSDAEPAAQIAVSQLQSDRISEPAVPPDNNINEPSLPPDQIIANPPKKINCHISPKPIESSEHAANIDEQMMKSHQDATGCQAANPNLCLIETTEGIKDQMEQIHNNLNEDNNSDVEVIAVVIKNDLAEPSETFCKKTIPIKNNLSISQNIKSEESIDPPCSEINNMVDAGLLTLTSQYPPVRSSSEDKKESLTESQKLKKFAKRSRYVRFRKRYEAVLTKPNKRFVREEFGLRDTITKKVLSCTFHCGGRHLPYLCPYFDDGEEKLKRCEKVSLCKSCLMPNNSHASFCSNIPVCPRCHKYGHHVVVCIAGKEAQKA